MPFIVGAPTDGVLVEADALDAFPNETTDTTAKIPMSAIFLSM